MARQGWGCAALGLFQPPAGCCQHMAGGLRVQGAKEGQAGKAARHMAVEGLRD